MSKKTRKGYFVRGHFVAEGSEEDQQLKAELKGREVSKTDKKRESEELQQLGQALLDLRGDLYAALALDEDLDEALKELRRISDFEGRRRQLQYVGKLMRRLDEQEVQAIRDAMEVQRQGSAEEKQALHWAEQWRERLIADDAALAQWLEEHPDDEIQPLRALIRQARKDGAVPTEREIREGQAPRKSKAYRELFQWITRAAQRKAQ